ncbi:MAG TPA: hypothetical protein VEZ47_01860 [Gemmatirosa sp.]|nr:hypothetical protein [Gemmatirosa sp.]
MSDDPNDHRSDATGPAPAAPVLPDTVRTYVNERAVDVPRGATVRAAISAFDADAGARLASGAVQVTDSRGLPLDADAPVHGGAIYRLVPVRTRRTGGDPAAAAPADPELPA